MKKIAIHSVPRSGSSWLGELINSSEHTRYVFQPLFSYEFKGRLNETSSARDIDDFFYDISHSNDEFTQQLLERESGKKPIFAKNYIEAICYKEVRYHYVLENMLKRDDGVRIIALVRNPLAVLASWYNAPREFRADLGWKFENEWLYASRKNNGLKEEYFGLEKWVQTTKLFESLNSKYPERCKIVNYIDLINDKYNQILSIYDFLDLEYTEQVDSFVNQDKEVFGTYSVMKSKENDNSWKDILPESIVKKVVSYVTKHGFSYYL